MSDAELLTWRWYCRFCGAGSDEVTEQHRDNRAFGHLVDGHRDSIDGGVSYLSTARSGRLLHVWLVSSPSLVMS